MKILFISDVSLGDPSSGSEIVLTNQAMGLAANGLDIYAITRRNGFYAKSEFNRISGVKDFFYYADTKKIGKFIYSVLIKPPKLIDKSKLNGKISTAICHQPFTCYSLLIRNKLKNIPILYIFHSPNHEEYLVSKKNKKGISTKIMATVRRIIERYCINKAQRIMVLSEYMKNKVIKIHKIPEKLIKINPGGVEINQFKPIESRHIIKETLCLPSNKIHLLTIRNLEARMGLDNLIKAIYFANKQNNKLHLTIGGDGPEKEYLKNFAKDLGITKQITFTGFIPFEELPKYYGAADFFVMPTRNLEGFGLATVESLACGTPVLGTPVGGTNEILLPLNDNFLFKDISPEAIAFGIQKAINNYYNDQNEYERLRYRCRKYVEKKYSWKRHIDQLIDIVAECNYENYKLRS